MKLDVTVPEVMEIIKGIQDQSGNFSEMIRVNVREVLSVLMDTELTGFLGRDRYERKDMQINHRNGFYSHGLL